MFVLAFISYYVFHCRWLLCLLSYILENMQKSKTEGFQSIPYAVAFFSAMLWIYYVLRKGNSRFLTIVGFVIELTYILIYFFCAPPKSKMTTAATFIILNVIVIGLIVIVIELTIKQHNVKVKILDWMNTAISIYVYIAPLSIIRSVIRMKIVEFMPFMLSLFLTLGAVAWVFYGFLLHDKFVAIPNVLGFLFRLVQMILYAVYKSKRKEGQESRDADAVNVDANGLHEVVIIVLGPTYREANEGSVG